MVQGNEWDERPTDRENKRGIERIKGQIDNWASGLVTIKICIIGSATCKSKRQQSDLHVCNWHMIRGQYLSACVCLLTLCLYQSTQNLI